VYLVAIPYLHHSKHCSKETGTKMGQDQSKFSLLAAVDITHRDVARECLSITLVAPKNACLIR
jgi:hypothetical protein